MALIDPGKLDDDARFGQRTGPNSWQGTHNYLGAGSPVRSCACFAEGQATIYLRRTKRPNGRLITTVLFTLSDQYDVYRRHTHSSEKYRPGTTPLVVVSATVPDDATWRV
jgi:hypothetical protein